MNKLTFYTNSIFPELTRIWYRFIERVTDEVDSEVVIYDCGSRLNPGHFENAVIVRRPNHDHGRKIDHFIRNDLKTRYFFLMDDDVFLLGDAPVLHGLQFLEENERNAICTFLPRHHWDLVVKGVTYKPMGSYALMIDAEIINREGLSFRSRKTDDPAIRNGSGYYDTADYINEQLLMRDYKIDYVPGTIRKEILTFWGTSSGYVSAVKRNLFGKLKMRLSREKLLDFIMKDPYNFQRVYMAVSVGHLYEKFFGESSELLQFNLDEMIGEILSQGKDEEFIKKLLDIKAGVDRTCETLLEHA